MKSGQRFVYGALATGLWVLGRGVVLAGGSGPLSAVEGLGIVWLGVSVLFVVFFWWGRTRARGPLDLGKHGRRLAWFWLVGVGLAVFEAPLCWWLRVEGLGMGDELGVGLAVGDVVLVSLVAVGLRWREPWAGPAAGVVSFWLAVWSGWGLALALYSWWVLVPGGRSSSRGTAGR